MLAGAGFGLDPSEGLVKCRLNLAATLADEAADGRSWILTLEDASSASPEVWEEIRALSNRIGQPGGFAALVLIAQTEMIRRLSSRMLAPFAGRITDHLHLAPLDLDECHALIRDAFPSSGGRISARSLEEIHRDARGNCAEVLRLIQGTMSRPNRKLAEGLTSTPDPVESEIREPERAVASPPSPSDRTVKTATASNQKFDPAGASIPQPALRPNLSLIPSRPPLRLEEGLIEVGWGGNVPLQSTQPVEIAERVEPAGFSNTKEAAEPDHSRFLEASAEVADSAGEVEAQQQAASDGEDAGQVEEWIEDPYAALQAWSEWSRNRERAGSPSTEQPRPDPDSEGARTSGDPQRDEEPDHSTLEGQETERPGLMTGAGVTLRAEGQHEFSPYSQLFSEIRKSKQP